MTPLAWLIIVMEVILCFWLVSVVWKEEQETPTETIVPLTDEDVELVG